MENDASIASEKVAAIVAAAEQAAEELRLKTEQRARDRIAEADRAAVLRVEAAEAEIREMLEEARGKVQAAEDESITVRAEAAAFAEEIVAKAKVDARGIVREAQVASRDVLAEGRELSGHLDELSVSLRRNAERLLRDIQLAHARLVAELDQAAPAGEDEPARVSRAVRGGGGDDAFDVPEFVPPP